MPPLPVGIESAPAARDFTRIYFLTVPHRILRFLMLWLFVALQAMTPFIHAHAGEVQIGHGGFLHVHAGAPVDAAWHAVASDAQGAEVAVEQGMRLRDSSLDAIAEAPPLPSLRLLRAMQAARPGAELPIPPALDLAPPEHTLPPALAPPAA
jgi:hypothetical protein